MPYKQNLKTPSKTPRPKPTYKITNWSDYNKSLKKRGMVSLCFPAGDLKEQFINDSPYVAGVSGRQATYSKAYLELIYTFYRLFGWGLRQMTGYFEDFWRQKGLDIGVPSFGHLCDAFSALSLEKKVFCKKVAQKIEAGEKITLILDSTGLRFFHPSDWYEKQYGQKKKRRPWRKVHMAIDAHQNVHQIEVTEETVDDRAVMGDLIDGADGALEKIIADQGYYSIEISENLYKQGITPVIPPPHKATIHDKENTSWHDKIVQYIKDKGSLYAFHKKFGYGTRSLVEAQFSRLKRCLGDAFQTHKIDSQKNEAIIIGNILNLWNSFGQCQSVKNS